MKFWLLVSLILAFALSQPASGQTPQGTAFTYQGELTQNGAPVDAAADFAFALFDSAVDGQQVGPTLAFSASGGNAVTVDDGIFTVALDFGPVAFAGAAAAARWLAVTVNGTTLAPRIRIENAPFALTAREAALAFAVPAGSIGADEVVASEVQLRGATTSCAVGQVVRAIDASGNVQCATDSEGTPAWSLSGNSGTSAGTQFLGTIDDEPLEIKVNGLRALRLEPTAAAGTPVNVIGGSSANGVDAGVVGATIGGGGNLQTPAFANRSAESYATIGGGHSNRVGDPIAVPNGIGSTVGGGLENLARGEAATVAGGRFNHAMHNFAFVGGGLGNEALQPGDAALGGFDNTAGGGISTVGGGISNVTSAQGASIVGGTMNAASGIAAFVGGGQANTASGFAAVVVGGSSNLAGGSHSFAGGRGAFVRDSAMTGEGTCSTPSAFCGDEGSFVWADATDGTIGSDAPNQFTVRATGGVRFFSGNGGGVSLAPGAGSWSALSDRDAKSDIVAVDAGAILDAVLALPIAEWSYRAQSSAIRHIGPMAQDFSAAFGLGESERHIATVDADGVALTAIQALNAKLEAEVAALAAENARLAGRLARIEAAMAEAPR